MDSKKTRSTIMKKLIKKITKIAPGALLLLALSSIQQINAATLDPADKQIAAFEKKVNKKINKLKKNAKTKAKNLINNDIKNLITQISKIKRNKSNDANLWDKYYKGGALSGFPGAHLLGVKPQGSQHKKWTEFQKALPKTGTSPKFPSVDKFTVGNIVTFLQMAKTFHAEVQSDFDIIKGSFVNIVTNIVETIKKAKGDYKDKVNLTTLAKIDGKALNDNLVTSVSGEDWHTFDAGSKIVAQVKKLEDQYKKIEADLAKWTTALDTIASIGASEYKDNSTAKNTFDTKIKGTTAENHAKAQIIETEMQTAFIDFTSLQDAATEISGMISDFKEAVTVFKEITETANQHGKKARDINDKLTDATTGLKKAQLPNALQTPFENAVDALGKVFAKISDLEDQIKQADDKAKAKQAKRDLKDFKDNMLKTAIENAEKFEENNVFTALKDFNLASANTQVTDLTNKFDALKNAPNANLQVKDATVIQAYIDKYIKDGVKKALEELNKVTDLSQVKDKIQAFADKAKEANDALNDTATIDSFYEPKGPTTADVTDAQNRLERLRDTTITTLSKIITDWTSNNPNPTDKQPKTNAQALLDAKAIEEVKDKAENAYTTFTTGLKPENLVARERTFKDALQQITNDVNSKNWGQIADIYEDDDAKKLADKIASAKLGEKTQIAQQLRDDIMEYANQTLHPVPTEKLLEDNQPNFYADQVQKVITDAITVVNQTDTDLGNVDARITDLNDAVTKAQGMAQDAKIKAEIYKDKPVTQPSPPTTTTSFNAKQIKTLGDQSKQTAALIAYIQIGIDDPSKVDLDDITTLIAELPNDAELDKNEVQDKIEALISRIDEQDENDPRLEKLDELLEHEAIEIGGFAS